MANCDNIVFWSPVPSGSVFKIKAAGDKTSFTIVVGRSRNGTAKPVIPFGDLVPGPAEQVVNAGDRWSFTPVISLFHTGTDPVTVEAWVEDGAGTTLNLPDDNGAPQPLQCSWTFNTVGGNALKIFVAA
ncbi:MAG TPA: hypothetical protein VFV49_09290 [Thermoanaerobaculia bacterium]|nr:hypothetical protein [Thermoanaerobaculia bacterium]